MKIAIESNKLSLDQIESIIKLNRTRKWFAERKFYFNYNYIVYDPSDYSLMGEHKLKEIHLVSNSFESFYNTIIKKGKPSKTFICNTCIKQIGENIPCGYEICDACREKENVRKLDMIKSFVCIKCKSLFASNVLYTLTGLCNRCLEEETKEVKEVKFPNGSTIKFSNNDVLDAQKYAGKGVSTDMFVHKEEELFKSEICEWCTNYFKAPINKDIKFCDDCLERYKQFCDNAITKIKETKGVHSAMFVPKETQLSQVTQKIIDQLNEAKRRLEVTHNCEFEIVFPPSVGLEINMKIDVKFVPIKGTENKSKGVTDFFSYD